MPSSARLPGTALIAAALVTISFVAFLPALGGDFVSDDVNAIVQNEHVTGPLDTMSIFTTFSWWGVGRSDAPGYRPLTTLTFALNHVTSGSYPLPYHLINVLLHALVSLLVYLTALSLGIVERGALLSALLFCVLPIHSEAVCWIVGRAELLAAIGFAGGLLLAISTLKRGGSIRLLASCLLYLAGLWGKETAIALLPLPALAYWLLPPFKNLPRRRVVAVMAALTGTTVGYFCIRAGAGPVLPSGGGDLLDNPLSVLPIGQRWMGAVSVLGRYARLLVWPHPLSADYSYDALGIGPGFRGDIYTVVGALGVIALAVFAWRSQRRDPAVTFSLLTAAAAYAAVSNVLIPIGTIMGERLVYLPSFGLCLAAGPVLARASERWGRNAMAVIGVAAFACVAVDYARAHAWRSPVSLFESATEAYPRSARSHMELASAYGHVGRLDEARREFARAVRIKPDYAAAWYNLGNLLARMGSYDEAAAAYEKALAYAPALAPAWYNLALIRQLQGRIDDARHVLETAVAKAPQDAAIRKLRSLLSPPRRDKPGRQSDP